MVFCRQRPRDSRSRIGSLPSLSFQSLPTIKWNYPRRIVHPERTGAPGEPGFGSLGWGSEGSLCEPEADTTKTFVLLSFQRVTTIKFCNHFLLITIRIARGVVPPHLSLASFTPGSQRLFSYTYELPNSQLLCFYHVATLPGDGAGSLAQVALQGLVSAAHCAFLERTL
jgi:hypothetical protein